MTTPFASLGNPQVLRKQAYAGSFAPPLGDGRIGRAARNMTSLMQSGWGGFGPSSASEPRGRSEGAPAGIGVMAGAPGAPLPGGDQDTPSTRGDLALSPDSPAGGRPTLNNVNMPPTMGSLAGSIEPIGGVGPFFGRPAPTGPSHTLPGGSGVAGNPGGGGAPGTSSYDTPSRARVLTGQDVPPAQPVDWNARFRKETGTDFNPQSRADAYSMQRLQAGQGTVDMKQWRQLGRPTSYTKSAASMPPFAVLEKKANRGLFGLAQQGVKSLGVALRRSGAKARGSSPGSKVTPGGPAIPMGKPTGPLNAPTGSTAIVPHEFANATGRGMHRMSGERRMALGKYLKDLSGNMDNASAGLKNTVNYTVPAVGGGAALYGSNRMGHSSGKEEGVGIGYDKGADAGLQTAIANMPQDPGILGRIMDVFTGTQGGPDIDSLKQLLASGREDALKTILRGTA